MHAMTTEDLILAALILIAAVLCSSVGHAGASGYLAAMALVGAVLIYAAWRSFSTAHRPAQALAVKPHRGIRRRARQHSEPRRPRAE